MIVRILSIAMLLGLPLVQSCNYRNQIIADFEMKSNHCKVDKILYFGLFNPFTANDSLSILKQQLKNQLEQRINSLKRQIDSLDNLIAKANIDMQTTHNEHMLKAFKNGIKNMEAKKKQLNSIYSLYQNHPEKTGFNKQIQQICRFTKQPEVVLAYQLRVCFIGHQGQLEPDTMAKTYLFSLKQDAVLNELKGYYPADE